jgi:fumarate reductase iron-sulfur subunit
MERKVVIWRGGPDSGTGFAEYKVPFTPRSTVLDALLYVQRKLDPTLAFRYACRKGMCGTCGIRVNSVERLACSTHLSVVPGKEVRLEPLRHLPIIRDLAVDFTPFFQRWVRLNGAFVSSDAGDHLYGSSLPEPLVRWRECISCGLCYSACDTVGRATSFAGPAALNRALTLALDPRDKGNRWHRVDRIEGALGCHAMGVCTLVCPKGLDPATAIQRLRWRRLA